MKAYYLTTEDNPYDPEKQFDDWFSFDEQMGYHSSGYLARIAKTSPDLSEADQQLAINDAVDEIVQLNLTGNYKRIVRDVELD
ncbi:MAG: hypothetical protein [Chaetfec virus UA24_144]|nr:MAG: hypothetical protein [Chaetfec virus UA24_144]